MTGSGKAFREGLSLPELFKLFPDDATAEAWFVKRRWKDGEPVCPACGHHDVQTGAAHKSMPFRCRSKECRKRFSVKTGTAMRSSNLGYRTWAIALYLVLTSINGVSPMRLRRDLKITQKSAWHLAHRIGAIHGTGRDGFGGKAKELAR
jgi:transposase-like protein